jgi:hypothetical protein
MPATTTLVGGVNKMGLQHDFPIQSRFQGEVALHAGFRVMACASDCYLQITNPQPRTIMALLI